MLESQGLSSLVPSVSVVGTPRSGSALTKDDFLRLLITQLRHQDPLNPLDQNEFLSQSAQFTALEELQNIGDVLEDLRAMSSGTGLVDHAVLLGRTVDAVGRAVTFDGASPVTLPFTTRTPAARVEVEIADGEGRVVRRLSQTAVEAGVHAIEWTGRDDAGQALSPGTYFYRVSSPRAEGASAPVVTSGTLTAIEQRGGQILFRVGDSLIRQDDIVSLG
jgi:flagellar basal-body rod modification protein FlgD